MVHDFAAFLNVNHPYNVNKKYESDFEILHDNFIGEGIKRTHAYKSTLTKKELENKRNEFWGRNLKHLFFYMLLIL